MYEINQAKLQEFISNLGTNQTNNNGQEPQISTEVAESLSRYKGYKPEEEQGEQIPAEIASTKSTNKQKTYKLGRRVGNTRIIDSDSVYNSRPSISINGGRISLHPNTTHTNTPYSNTTDGYIGDSRQKKRGDCYFLAELNAIRNTKAGQKVLQQNCKKNKDGSYTVTLPGANKIREEYAKRGLECPITGTYKISKSALNIAGNNSMYSKGDLEVVAYELAMEAYRAEMYLNQKQHGKAEYGTAEGHRIGTQGNGDVLSGGYAFDAGFILTGGKSEVFMADKKRYASVSPYKDGKYGYITRQEMAKRSGADISMYQAKTVGVSEVSSYTQKEQAINSMLNKYEGKEGSYALTVNVRVAENGPDGITKAGGGHVLTIAKITKDTVYVANPWHPNKIEPIPRKDFIKMTAGLEAMPVTAPQKPLKQQGLNLSTILHYWNKK